MDLNCRMQRHTGLTQTERHLRDYILQNPERMARMNVRELAQASFTSPSAVIRFCQKFGYKGLKDFKADLLCGSEEQGAGELPDSNYPFGADTPFAALCAASYGEDGQLLDLALVQCDLAAGINSLSLPLEELGDVCRVFLWRSTNCKPLSPSLRMQ